MTCLERKNSSKPSKKIISFLELKKEKHLFFVKLFTICYFR